MLKWGLLGEIHFIRAQWHRGNLPGRDSWKPPVPGGEVALVDDPKKRFKKGQVFNEIAWQLKRFEDALKKERDAGRASLLTKQIAQWTAWNDDQDVKAKAHGYVDLALPDRTRTALEELVRWRLWDRTGGGLMAELGSHQLDAASIFISALRSDNKKAHPLNVQAFGRRYMFPYDREADDHVYCMYEFPAPGYEAEFNVGYVDPMAGVGPKQPVPAFDPEQHDSKRIVVTYSSINGNGWGGYGETVMGTRGTMVVDGETEVMLYKDSDKATKVGVKETSGGAVLDTQASGNMAAVAEAASSGPVSRGYREEMEHWAWCIRNPAKENQPRCHPRVALGDAVIALATKVAIDNAKQGKGGYLAFEEDWFELDNDATPDGSSIESEKTSFG